MGIKTPVSILQEILSRQGITPSYELVRIEGAHHEPTFRYRVWYNDKDGKFDCFMYKPKSLHRFIIFVQQSELENQKRKLSIRLLRH